MYRPTIHLLQGPDVDNKATWTLEKIQEKKPNGRNKYIFVRRYDVGHVLRAVLDAISLECDIIFDPNTLTDDQIAELHHGIVGYGVLDIKRFDVTGNKEEK